jgi:glutamate transport system substrate-binding protein
LAILKRAVALPLCAVLALAAGCGTSTAPDAQHAVPSCSSALGAQNINIGILADEPGWGLRMDNYQRSGFDFDLANWLAAELCFRPSFVDVSLNQREDALLNGQVRLVIATYSKTDERAKHISFAAPYAINHPAVLVRAGDQRIRTLADLNYKTVCTGANTTTLENLHQAASLHITVVQEEGMSRCATAVANGDVDAMVSDELPLYGLVHSDPRLAVVDGLTFGYQDRYGIGFAHGDTKTCEILVAAVRKFIATGAWDALFSANLPNVQRHDPYKPDPNILDRCPPPDPPASPKP